jgi:tetratricopeptide (TPR) repeat protein
VANLALILSEEGRVDESIRLYKKAIELNPLASLNYSNIANRYIALQMYAEAEENLKIAVELDPKNWHALYVYSLLYSGLGMYENSKIYAEKFIQLDPDNIFFLEYAADIVKDFDFDLAEKYFSKGYNASHFDPEVYSRTALFFGAQIPDKLQEPPSDQLLNKVIDFLSEKAEKGALNGEGLLILTQAYAVLGDKATTLDWLEKTFQAGLIYDRPIKKDLWLKVLNDDPKFIEMVDEMNKKVTKMQETLLSDGDIRQ